MRSCRLALFGTTAAGIVLSLSSIAVASAAPPTATPLEHPKKGAYSFAVIGDIPYGGEQVAQFPQVIEQINGDPDVRLVNHIEDIKSGSTACSDAYYRLIRSDFELFRDPLVYTIGDNEWTDCHRPNNGGYQPLERLAQVRDVFFRAPGRTLGQRSVRVHAETRAGYPENVRYTRAGVSFGVPHIVGSNNGLTPWTGNTTATPEQTAEVLGRTASAIKVIQDTFRDARAHHGRTVALMTQADMFNGDSHVYNADQPLRANSPWLSFYGVETPARNLQRITLDGSDNNNNYLKVTVRRGGTNALSWDRVPYAREGL